MLRGLQKQPTMHVDKIKEGYACSLCYRGVGEVNFKVDKTKDDMYYPSRLCNYCTVNQRLPKWKRRKNLTERFKVFFFGLTDKKA